MSNAFIGSNDLVEIQDEMELSLFDQGDTLNRWVRTRAKDAMGALVDTWTIEDADIPVIVSQSAGNRGQVADGEVSIRRIEISMSASHEINPGDQLRDYSGRVFHVDATNSDDTISVFRVCTCTRLDQLNQPEDVSGD